MVGDDLVVNTGARTKQKQHTKSQVSTKHAHTANTVNDSDIIKKANSAIMKLIFIACIYSPFSRNCFVRKMMLSTQYPLGLDSLCLEVA